MSRAEIIHGDCLEVMAGMAAGSVDTIITDPPYGLKFMGKEWDHGVPGAPFWTEALRVARPGAYLLAFGGTRTWHRLAVAIEDAGWEIRDTMSWLYGSGFPKSLDISKALDKAAGAEREVVGESSTRLQLRDAAYFGWNGKERTEGGGVHITAPATPLARAFSGYGTALKPAWEPIIVAMKPCEGTFAQNAAEHGVAGLWIDGARVGTHQTTTTIKDLSQAHGNQFGKAGITYPKLGEKLNPPGRWPANVVLGCACEGEGHAEGCAVRVLDEQSGERKSSGHVNMSAIRNNGGPVQFSGSKGYAIPGVNTYNDTGGASRFFYCAKASRAERNAGLEGMEERGRTFGHKRCAKCGKQKVNVPGSACVCPAPEWVAVEDYAPRANHHPTVKPIALMRWLARLTRPPHGGVVLDPFAGSGSTGVACIMEGRDFIGIELEADYVAIARARIAHAEREAAQLPLAIGAD